MTQYLVIYERAEHAWGAYSPDLPGCVAAGRTRDEVETLMSGAVKQHLDVMREQGLPAPTPSSFPGFVAA
jgi:predicted RNase H-like HicB family nuclease